MDDSEAACRVGSKQSVEFPERHPLQCQPVKKRRLYQGPISDFSDRTEVGDLVYVAEADFPPGNYRVVGITYRRCCKSLVLDNGATIYCSQAKLVFPKFVPTEAERECGKYIVVFERVREDGEWDIFSTAHILPLFGRNHIIDKSCWCEPRSHKSDDGTDFFVHEPNH